MRSPVNRHRFWQLVADAVLIAVAWLLAFQLRFDSFGKIPPFYEKLVNWETVLLVVGIKLVVFTTFGFYNRWWRYVSTRDMWGAARGVTVASLAASLVVYFFPPADTARLPRGVAILDWLLLLALVAGSRLLARTIFERPGAASLVARGKEVVIVGAGDAAQLVIREMQKSRALGYTPIGVVDDDPRKKNLRLHGVRVLGTTDELPHILRDNKPDELLIAIPSASGEVRQKVVEHARDARVPVKTLPGLYELISGDANLAAQIRPVQVEDILGREPVEVDFEAIAEYLRGETVLISGAGGSIGSELCRQAARAGAARLILVDQAESPLYEIERELVDDRGFPAAVPVIADVGNREKLRWVFERYQPSVVFHAAAYKHVPMMEANPLESVRNNVLATKVLAQVAVEFGAKRFVLISTDKALNAQAVYGQSKALCEWIVEAYGARDDVVDPLRRRALRERPRLGRLGDPDLQEADREGRAGDGHEPGDDALLHDDARGGVARDPGRLDRRARRDLRPGHGRAGQDPRPRAQHDPALREGARARDPDRVHRRSRRARSCTRSSGARTRWSRRPGIRRSTARGGRPSTASGSRTSCARSRRSSTAERRSRRCRACRRWCARRSASACREPTPFRNRLFTNARRPPV